ncbi:MAG: HEAT repeat domain-containing protein, partial [Phycisphaerales bacterium]|nr:HEAT repeat domain-containing protein [Phycisphaerales bacterium]
MVNPPGADAADAPTPTDADVRSWITDLRASSSGHRRVLGVRVRFLKASGPPTSAVALVCAWHHLEPARRDEAWELVRPILPGVLTLIDGARHAADFVGACALIGERALCEHAGILLTALQLDGAGAREASARAFVELSRTPDLDHGARQALLSALLVGAERFDAHRAEGVIEALARCAALWPGAWAAACSGVPWLSDETHPASMVVRAHLRRSADPSAGAAAWRWMTTRSLRTACVVRITAPLPGDSVAWFLRSAHLLLNPARARVLKALPGVHAAPSPAADRRDRPKSMLTPEQAVVDRCDLPARLGAVRLARLAPAPLHQRDSLLAGRLLDDSTLVRLGASIAAATSSLPLSCESDYVFDPDSRVARHSALSMLATTTRGALEAPARQRLALSLLRSPHASVRDIGSAALARDGVVAGLAVSPALNGAPASDASDAARIIEITRTGRAQSRATELMDFVRNGVGATQPVMPIEPPEESRSGRPLRALSAAAAALGHVSDVGADALLRALLEDPDARVRSNAVEAIARRARRALPGAPGTPLTAPLLIGLLSDEHHRVVGSAARAMIQLGRATRQAALLEQGQRAVLKLMADHRPLRKRAGLWAAAHVAGQIPDVTEFLDAAQRARRDADEVVSTSASLTS